MNPAEEWLALSPEFVTRAKVKTALRDIGKVSNQYADALVKMSEADAKMRRAFHAYERARKEVRRLEKILDKPREVQHELA